MMRLKLLTIIIVAISGCNGQNLKSDSVKKEYISGNNKFKLEKTYYESGKLKIETMSYENKVVKSLYFSKGGQLIQESNFDLNGDEMGLQKEYFENGNLKMEKYIVNYSLVKEKREEEDIILKVFNGTIRELYENGNVKTESTYSNGKKVGLYKEGLPNGEIKKIEYLNYGP